MEPQDYQTPIVRIVLVNPAIVAVVIKLGDVTAEYNLDIGENAFGSVEISKVMPIFVYSGDYLSRITIRVKGRVPHSYQRIDHDYTIYSDGRFARDFHDFHIERDDGTHIGPGGEWKVGGR